MRCETKCGKKSRYLCRGNDPFARSGDFISLTKGALQNRDSHAEEDGIAQQPKSPNPKTHQRFVERRRIFHHRTERCGHKSRYDQAHALFNPDTDNAEHTSKIEP